MIYKAFLLLRAVAYAQISIRVQSDTEQKIFHYGDIEEIVSDTERQTWKITDEQLKDAFQACIGKRPDDVYVRSPPGNLELYKRDNIQEVHRILRPISARILSITYETELLASTEYFNHKYVTKEHFKVGTTFYLENTASITWHTEGNLTVGQQISHSFIMHTLTVLSFNGSWGENTTISKTVTVPTNSRVKVEPRETVVANVTATHGRMEVQVNYAAKLSGQIACIYKDHYVDPKDPLLIGDHLDTNNCLNRTDMPKDFFSNVLIKIDFYADPQLTLYDSKKKNITRINLS